MREKGKEEGKEKRWKKEEGEEGGGKKEGRCYEKLYCVTSVTF